MKIVKIETFHLRVEDPSIQIFDGSYDDCVIRITTDDGLTGIGEAETYAPAVQAIVHGPSAHNHARGLAEILLGRDPRPVAELWRELYEATNYVGRRGLSMHALGLVDLALMDLKGKAAGKPVHALLGGARHARIPAYGTIYPMARTPDAVARQVEDRVNRLSLRNIKFCADPWWMDDIGNTARCLEAARAVIGSAGALIVDAALAYHTPAEGLRLFPAYKKVNLLFLEAPLPLDDVEGHAEMARHGLLTGVGDLGLTHVNEFVEMMDRGGATICQPDISMVGGFTGIATIAQAAHARGKRVITHGYKTNIEIAANLHFLAAQPRLELLEFCTSVSPLRWEMTNEQLPVEADGCVAVPQAPGLGVTLNEATLKKHTYRAMVSQL